VLFLVALAVTSMNVSAIRNSLADLTTTRSTSIGTDEEVLKASLFLTFLFLSYPIYKLILHLKASTLVQTCLLLSVLSMLLFGSSSLIPIHQSPTLQLAGVILQETVHLIVAIPILPFLISSKNLTKFRAIRPAS